MAARAVLSASSAVATTAAAAAATAAPASIVHAGSLMGAASSVGAACHSVLVAAREAPRTLLRDDLRVTSVTAAARGSGGGGGMSASTPLSQPNVSVPSTTPAVVDASGGHGSARGCGAAESASGEQTPTAAPRRQGAVRGGAGASPTPQPSSSRAGAQAPSSGGAPAQQNKKWRKVSPAGVAAKSGGESSNVGANVPASSFVAEAGVEGEGTFRDVKPDAWVRAALMEAPVLGGKGRRELTTTEIKSVFQSLDPRSPHKLWTHILPAANALIRADRLDDTVAASLMACIFRCMMSGKRSASLTRAADTTITHLLEGGRMTTEIPLAKYCRILGLAGSLPQAFDTIRLLLARGIWPSAFYFNDLMKAAADARRFDLVVKIYATMHEFDSVPHISSRKILLHSLKLAVSNLEETTGPAALSAALSARVHPPPISGAAAASVPHPSHKAAPAPGAGPAAGLAAAEAAASADERFRTIDTYLRLILQSPDGRSHPAARAEIAQLALRLLLQYAPYDADGMRFASMWRQDVMFSRLRAMVRDTEVMAIMAKGDKQFLHISKLLTAAAWRLRLKRKRASQDVAYSYHEGADGATANRDPVAAGAAAASALAPQVSAGGGSAWDAPVAPGLRAQADGLDAYFRERATPQALLSAAAGAIAELKAASVDTLRGTGGSSDAGTVVEDAIASDDEENEFIPATLSGGAVGAASSLFPAINLRDGLGEDALSPLASAAASMSAAAAGGASSAGASRGGAAYTVAGAANNAAAVSLGTGSSLPGSANVTYASAGVRTALPASLMSVEEMQISLTDGRVEAIVNERAVALLTCVRTQLQQAHRRGDEALRGVYVDRAETILRVMQEEGVDVDSRVVAAYISVVISSGFPHKLRTVMPMLGGLPSGSAARHFNKVLCELASPDTAATILRMLPDLTAFGVRPAAATLDTLSRMATDKWLRGQSVTCPQCLELRTGACANAAPVSVARAPPASPPSSASMTDGSRLSVDAGLLADVQEPIAPADAKPRRARRTVENYKRALLNAFASERRGSTVVTCAAASEQQAASVHSVHTHTVFPSQQLKLFESAGTLSELPPITTIRLALAATRLPCAREAWEVWSRMRRLGMPAALEPMLLRRMLRAFVAGDMRMGAWEAYTLLNPRRRGALPSLATLRALVAAMPPERMSDGDASAALVRVSKAAARVDDVSATAEVLPAVSSRDASQPPVPAELSAALDATGEVSVAAPQPSLSTVEASALFDVAATDLPPMPPPPAPLTDADAPSAASSLVTEQLDAERDVAFQRTAPSVHAQNAADVLEAEASFVSAHVALHAAEPPIVHEALPHALAAEPTLASSSAPCPIPEQPAAAAGQGAASMSAVVGSAPPTPVHVVSEPQPELVHAHLAPGDKTSVLHQLRTAFPHVHCETHMDGKRAQFNISVVRDALRAQVQVWGPPELNALLANHAAASAGDSAATPTSQTLAVEKLALTCKVAAVRHAADAVLPGVRPAFTWSPASDCVPSASRAQVTADVVFFARNAPVDADAGAHAVQLGTLTASLVCQSEAAASRLLQSGQAPDALIRTFAQAAALHAPSIVLCHGSLDATQPAALRYAVVSLRTPAHADRRLLKAATLESAVREARAQPVAVLWGPKQYARALQRDAFKRTMEEQLSSLAAADEPVTSSPPEPATQATTPLALALEPVRVPANAWPLQAGAAKLHAVTKLTVADPSTSSPAAEQLSVRTAAPIALVLLQHDAPAVSTLASRVPALDASIRLIDSNGKLQAASTRLRLSHPASALFPGAPHVPTAAAAAPLSTPVDALSASAAEQRTRPRDSARRRGLMQSEGKGMPPNTSSSMAFVHIPQAIARVCVPAADCPVAVSSRLRTHFMKALTQHLRKQLAAEFGNRFRLRVRMAMDDKLVSSISPDESASVVHQQILAPARGASPSSGAAAVSDTAPASAQTACWGFVFAEIQPLDKADAARLLEDASLLPFMHTRLADSIRNTISGLRFSYVCGATLSDHGAASSTDIALRHVTLSLQPLDADVAVPAATAALPPASRAAHSPRSPPVRAARVTPLPKLATPLAATAPQQRAAAGRVAPTGASSAAARAVAAAAAAATPRGGAPKLGGRDARHVSSTRASSGKKGAAASEQHGRRVREDGTRTAQYVPNEVLHDLAASYDADAAYEEGDDVLPTSRPRAAAAADALSSIRSHSPLR